MNLNTEVIVRLIADEMPSEWLFEIFKSFDTAIEYLESKTEPTERELEDLTKKRVQRERCLNAILTLQDHKL